MIFLMQILNLLNQEQKDLLLDFYQDPDEGFGPDELADSTPDLLANHFGIVIEMTNSQRETLARVIENGSYKSAFNLAGIKGRR